MITGMLQELERTFAFLLLTQRGAIAPENFKKALPVWYRSGLQQDSSEFGK